jgi:hypothetical protein
MIYSTAYRRILDRVNAQRGDNFKYRNKGTLAHWMSAHDRFVYLDGLTLRVQFGPLGAKQLVAANGEAQPADIERTTQQILDYFGRTALEHAA